MIDGAGTHNYSYDTRDRLTAATHPNQPNESYTFDDVGNRTASHQGSSYSYQSFNRLVTANSATFEYDDNGNLISKSDTGSNSTHAWDSENRLKQVALAGGVTITYGYDALGRRVKRSASSGSIKKFVFDGADVVRELDANLVVAVDYLNGLGIDDKLQQTSGGTTAYYLLDHLGSTRALADDNGNIVASSSYDSFGGNTGGPVPTGYGYTGREIDADTGLMYYRARWYDPQQGRFQSVDPIGFRGGDINLYGYVLNNPANFRDPTGTQRSDRDRPGDVEWARGLRKAIERMPQPAPSGCLGAAWGPLGAIGDFWGNYNDMRGANTIGADKFFHCMANCEAARRGRSGRLVSRGLSELREFFDEYIKGDPRSACNADRYANNVGQAGGSACRPCSQVCGGFKPNGLIFPVPRPAPKRVDWGTRSWGGGGRGW